MTEPPSDTVCAVIVAYRPEPATLRRLVEGMAVQVGAVVVIDNTGAGDWQAGLATLLASGRGALVCPSGNVGLGAAQNIGIDWARTRGYRHVLLLDQDSEPAPAMVATLLDALRRLSSMGNVAAVGPRFHDPREQRDAPFVSIRFPFNRKSWCGPGTSQVACDFLISSGTLIPLAVLEQVGPMDASLFIDNVDLEWCFRAQSLGYALYGVCGATMHHRLGDDRRRLPGGGQVVVHGPVRLYYMMRNRLRLYRMPHTPGVWIAQDLPRVLVKLFLFGVMIGPRRRHLRYMVRGLWDGVRNRKGAIPARLLP